MGNTQDTQSRTVEALGMLEGPFAAINAERRRANITAKDARSICNQTLWCYQTMWWYTHHPELIGNFDCTNDPSEGMHDHCYHIETHEHIFEHMNMRTLGLCHGVYLNQIGIGTLGQVHCARVVGSSSLWLPVLYKSPVSTAAHSG